MDGAEFRELGEKLAEALESNPEFAEQVEAVEAAAVKSQFKPSTPGAQAVISSLYGATDTLPESLKSYKEAVVPVSPVNTPSNKVAKPEQVEKPAVQKPQPTIPVVNNQKKSDDDDNEFRVPIIRKN